MDGQLKLIHRTNDKSIEKQSRIAGLYHCTWRAVRGGVHRFTPQEPVSQEIFFASQVRREPLLRHELRCEPDRLQQRPPPSLTSPWHCACSLSDAAPPTALTPCRPSVIVPTYARAAVSLRRQRSFWNARWISPACSFSRCVCSTYSLVFFGTFVVPRSFFFFSCGGRRGDRLGWVRRWLVGTTVACRCPFKKMRTPW